MVEVVRQQAEVGIDVISDGEMGKTSFLAYADERLTGFVALTADALDVPSSNVGGSWARRIDTGGSGGLSRVLPGVFAARDASRHATCGVPGTHFL